MRTKRDTSQPANLICEHCRKVGINQNGWCFKCHKYTNNWQERYKNQFRITVGSPEYHDQMGRLCRSCLIFEQEDGKCSYCQKN